MNQQRTIDESGIDRRPRANVRFAITEERCAAERIDLQARTIRTTDDNKWDAHSTHN